MSLVVESHVRYYADQIDLFEEHIANSTKVPQSAFVEWPTPYGTVRVSLLRLHMAAPQDGVWVEVASYRRVLMKWYEHIIRLHENDFPSRVLPRRRAKRSYNTVRTTRTSSEPAQPGEFYAGCVSRGRWMAYAIQWQMLSARLYQSDDTESVVDA